ncbi:exodeoxyribonuclease V subunit gamma, partial [Neisseria sp. P0021.S005]
RNDAEFAPSSLISELLDTIAAMTGKSGRELSEKWVKHHPLQAFSRRYFQKDALSDGLFSTRQDYADALNQPQAEAQPFFREALSQEEPGKTIHQGELVSFWRNPVKVWLKKNLSWDQPYLDGAWESAEPFEPQHEGRIADAYLDARRKGEDFEDTAIRLNAESLMPVGELGSLWQKQYQISAKNMDAELIRSDKRPSEPYEESFDDLVLQGTIGNLYECGRIVFLNQKDNAPNRIARLLEHLIFCAVAPKSVANRQTHIVSLGQTETYAAIEQQTAKELLKEWLVYFRIGQNTPLPFFAKTSLAAAEEYNKKEDWDAALSKAHDVFNGNKMSKGQKEYTEVKLVFGHSEESPLDEPLFENLIVNLLVPLLTGVAGKTDTTE